MAGDERGLLVDDLIHTEVGVEVGLDGLEDSDRTIGTPAAGNGRR